MTKKMLSAAELFIESIYYWPEPMAVANLTGDDWKEIAGLLIYKDENEKPIYNPAMAIIDGIEKSDLKISDFDGVETVFVWAFERLMDTGDMARIRSFHQKHAPSVVKYLEQRPIEYDGIAKKLEILQLGKKWKNK